MASKETIGIAVKSLGRRVAKQRKELNKMNKRNSIAAGTALMAVALAFTGQFESAGGKPHLTAYRDQGGVVTICNGITGPDIKLGMTVAKGWCDNRFAAELEKHSKPLDKVPYQMSNRSRVAWSDFLFNLGTGIASDASTPWRRLVAGDWRGSCDAFLMYRYTKVNGVKRDCSNPASKCTGIWTRRNAERDLCQGRISDARFRDLVEGLPIGGEL
jgi:lysozyme